MPTKLMDNIVITGHHYMHSNDILFNISVVVGIICATVVVVAYKSKRQVEPTKCGCGKSESGYCDGSHNSLAAPSNNNIENSNSPASGSVEFSA